MQNLSEKYDSILAIQLVFVMSVPAGYFSLSALTAKGEFVQN